MNELEQINQFLGVTGNDFVRRVHELQAHLQALPTEIQQDPPIFHHFGHNTYVREMHSPKHSIIVGKTHRHDHVCIVVQGSAMVYSEHGPELIQAPYTFTSQAGAKRLFVVLEDLIFQTVHYTQSRDLAAIEQELIVPDSEVEQFRNDHHLGESSCLG